MENSRVSKKIVPALIANFRTLIPKIEGVDAPDKFLPISLCNVIYKIITKVTANILKPILPVIIYPE